MTLAASRSSFGRANGVSRGGSLGPSIFSQSPTAKASTSLFVPRLPGPAWVPGVVCPALTPFQQRGRAGNDASLVNAKTSPHRGVECGWMASGPARSHSASLPTHEEDANAGGFKPAVAAARPDAGRHAWSACHGWWAVDGFPSTRPPLAGRVREPRPWPAWTMPRR